MRKKPDFRMVARTASPNRCWSEPKLASGAGPPESAEPTVEILAGGEATEGGAVFASDPLAGDFTVRIAGFRRGRGRVPCAVAGREAIGHLRGIRASRTPERVSRG